MKILILLSTFDLGGAEKHGFILADYFKNTQKHDVQLWAFGQGNGVVSDMCEKSGIKTKLITRYYRIQKYLFLIQTIQFRKVFSDFCPDVIISFNLLPNVFKTTLFLSPMVPV